MFNKLVDLIKEVFFIKKKASRKGKRLTSQSSKKKRTLAPSKSVKSKPSVRKTKAVDSSARPKKLQGTSAVATDSGTVKSKTKAVSIDPALKELGVITHFFERIKVVVVKLTHGGLIVGDKITIIGPKTKHVQKVWSMQVEHQDVKVAKKGQLIGLKVDKNVMVGDKVYK